MRVGVLCAMGTELRAVVRALGMRRVDGRWEGHRAGIDVEAGLIGVGPTRAGEGTRRFLEGRHLDRVIVAGVSGGLDPSLPIGALFVPASVVDFEKPLDAIHPSAIAHTCAGTLGTCAELITDEVRLAAGLDAGVMAVDMESYAVGVVCGDAGVPWTVIRTISDRQDGDLVDDRIMGLLRPDGGVAFGALATLLLRHPLVVRDLSRLASGFRQALGRLGAATVAEVDASERLDGGGTVTA